MGPLPSHVRALFRRPILGRVPVLLLVQAACGGGSSKTVVVQPPAPAPVPSPVDPTPPVTPTGSSPAVPAGTNGIGSVIISQGVQDPTGKTPLVAGRDATVRVFLASPVAGNTAQPTVNVTLRDGTGAVVLNQNIAAPGAGIPGNPQIGNFTDAWNLDVPGTLIQPGLTFQASIVAGSGSQGLTQLTWPADGNPGPLNVVLSGNTLRITLVPVTTSFVDGGPKSTGQVLTATRTLQDWVKYIRQWYPIGSAPENIDIQVASQAWDSGLAYPGSDPLTNIFALRDGLEAKRKATPGSAFRFYVGVFPFPPDTTVLGLGFLASPGLDGKKSMLVYDIPPSYVPEQDGSESTLAHELGHCLGRMHAPCLAQGTDPNFPSPKAYLGTWGLDTPTHTIIDPQENRDLMGYCAPYWSSQYTYVALQKAMASDQAGLAEFNSANVVSALLVRAQRRPGGAGALCPGLEGRRAPGLGFDRLPAGDGPRPPLRRDHRHGPGRRTGPGHDRG